MKYPRTPHLPWSPGAGSDDVRLKSMDTFEGREVVVTEKLDGENTTLYRDGLHARSLDSAHHPSRTWVKALHARIGSTIPEGWRICGENLAARHSITYDHLSSFFYAFSVWNGGTALGWDDTLSFCHERGLPTPRVRYRGPFDRKLIRKLVVQAHCEEGYVVRVADAFERGEFGKSMAKWVRPSHVQTDAHWMLQEVVPNGLCGDAALWAIRSGDRVDHEALDELVGGERSTIDRDGLGDRRLALVLAARLASRSRGELLPELVPKLGLGLARRVADLVGLAPLLHRPIPETHQLRGLRTLARSVDLSSLHALAGEDERIRWSRLVAEDAGLLIPDPLAGFREATAHHDPAIAAFRLHHALQAFSADKLRSPAEAEAFTHGLVPRGALTVLVGPSGSGKSTVAKDLPGPRHELDALRARHDDPLTEGLRRLDAASGSGVWDATCLTRQQRDLPLAVAARHGSLVQLLSVLTPRPLAEARNARRSRRVTAEVMEKQWRRIRWPYPHEGPRLTDHDGSVET